VYVIVASVLDAVRTLFNANDAVEANDDDTAEPVAIVTGNVEPSPFVNVITLATALAVVNNELVLTVVPAFKANEAVVANDADIACDEVIAKLPVIVFPKPSCNSLPLICVRN
jgi:hypothetical protein